jgi:hypothetical protein
MLQTLRTRTVDVTHTLRSRAWQADVATLEEGIRAFPRQGPAGGCRVAMFEMPGDSRLHVNVTHPQERRRVAGWAGPGACLDGFVHNRMFDLMPLDQILRQIHHAVFAPRA